MHITNISRNIAGTLSLTNRQLRQQGTIKELSTMPYLLPKSQERKSESNNISENFSGLFKFGPNYWQQFLQKNNFKLNEESGSVDILEHIKEVCEPSDKLFADSLLAEKTCYTYQTKDGKELSYLTFYEKNRIYCKKEGEDGYEWEIPLEDEAQYDKIITFLNELEDKKNLSFTIHNTFWQDFLSGSLDVDAFQKNLCGSEREEISNGFRITEDGSFHGNKYVSYIYGPEFGVNMIRTSEELCKWQEKQAEKNGSEWSKTHLTWVEQWNKEHPKLIGVKCICHSNGQWYTAEEIDKLWNKEMKSDGVVFI